MKCTAVTGLALIVIVFCGCCSGALQNLVTVTTSRTLT